MKFVKAPESSAGWFDAADGTVQLIVFSVVLLVFAIIALRFVLGKRWSDRSMGRQAQVPSQASSSCRWQRDAESENSLERWRCENCGVDAFTSTGKPPKECKRQLKVALL